MYRLCQALQLGTKRIRIIKFNANVTAPGTLSLKLNPAIGNKANVNFDLYVVHWADRRLHTRLMTVRVQIL